MSSELLYQKGAQIWIPHPEDVWEEATITENYQKGCTVLKIIKSSGRLLDVAIKPNSNLPPLRNPIMLIGNKDLTSLSYLHEPAVLHNLRFRFVEKQNIYTYCGIILVAINPYANLALYGPDVIRTYRGSAMSELEPHIFALAEEAYTKLEREKCNLSVIVTGESGAGKTVSAKYVMRYFAAVGGSESETAVERKVMASSPILEAFGNAKTIRNDNSSRFGKFTKLLFKNNMDLMSLTGATMHTYLLEKSRVIYQAPGERNYHIFYQLCAARKDFPTLCLEHQSKFEFLNMGKCSEIERVSDLEQYKETMQAMDTLGFNEIQRNDVIQILAGILHLGNIQLMNVLKNNADEIDPDSCNIEEDDFNLNLCADVLQINALELRKWLLSRRIESVSEILIIPNQMSAVQAARDALAKHIYAKLFQYIVSVINKSLNFGRKQGCFIGVLDIYGFETFEVNSFEQFCINYANEKLQQQFNQHVFKLEQEEYLKEGIVWTMIDYYDNQPCIDLIEAKLGVLDLLDEECRMPKGSDENWAGKLYEKCDRFPHFEKPRFGNTSFCIRHFCDTVEYDVRGFLEKNRDTVSKELVNVVRKSKMSLCKQLIEMEEIDTLSADANKTTALDGRVVISASRHQVIPSKQNKRSVGSQFRESLSSLIGTLHETTPHYIRCIKPNDDKIAFKWEASKIVQQLRACGVLETVRISAAGFPSRWKYQDFYIRYMLLCHRSRINKADIQATCREIVKGKIEDAENYRFGNTQIFFRAGQVAFLEQERSALRKRYIIRIQSVVRGFIARRRYLRLQRTAMGLQRFIRGYMARQQAQRIREHRAALIISKYARGMLCRRRYLRLRRTISGIQQYARGMLARKRFQDALEHHRAVQIQRFMRGYLARRAYRRRLHDIIICQAAVRRYLARKLVKRMKKEAKTISHIEKMYKGLENKIISMQQKIDELNRENNNLKSKTSEISVLKMKLELKKSLEIEVKQLKAYVKEKDMMINQLNSFLESERDEKMNLLIEKSTIADKWTKNKLIWSSEWEQMIKQFEDMIEQGRTAESCSKVHQERVWSEVELNELHEAYQRTLKDKEVLDRENFVLKEELNRIHNPTYNSEYNINHSRTMSNASSQNDDDMGYASARNTIETRRHLTAALESNHHNSPENFAKYELTSTQKPQTSLALKLRSLLDEEKRKNESLTLNLHKLMNRNRPTEDSLRKEF